MRVAGRPLSLSGSAPTDGKLRIESTVAFTCVMSSAGCGGAGEGVRRIPPGVFSSVIASGDNGETNVSVSEMRTDG